MHAAIVNSPKGLLFYWNLDGAVGRNGVNKFDDVLFVQWCFYKLSQWGQLRPELRDEIKRIGVDGQCSGRDGDPLVDGIKALQRGYGWMVDGRVSPVTKSSGQYVDVHGHRGTFLLLYPLNAVLAQMHPEQWPRIDLMPEFIWRIKDKATAPFAW